jgi:hypothetical protein
MHKFHCVVCHRNEFGNTAAELARAVNTHMQMLHPMDSANWNADSVTRSRQYSGPATPAEPGALPQYLVSHGTSPNSPHLTEDDRQFLAKARVKW